MAQKSFKYRHPKNQVKKEWPFVSAKDYTKQQSIFQAFPHLKGINPEGELQQSQNIRGVVIRSSNQDNIHKAIKYGIWTTTFKKKNKLKKLYKQGTNNPTVYLFFSVRTSNMFEGVAKIKSHFHQDSFPYWMQNADSKFKGYFQIQWVYIKDVHTKYLAGLSVIDQRERIDIYHSKDCAVLDLLTTTKLLRIFHYKKKKRSIFDAFAYMDQRQTEYIRKVYESNQFYTMNGPNPFNNAGSFLPARSFQLSHVTPAAHPLQLASTQNNVPPQLIPFGLSKPMGSMPPIFKKQTQKQQSTIQQNN